MEMKDHRPQSVAIWCLSLEFGSAFMCDPEEQPKLRVQAVTVSDVSVSTMCDGQFPSARNLTQGMCVILEPLPPSVQSLVYQVINWKLSKKKPRILIFPYKMGSQRT